MTTSLERLTKYLESLAVRWSMLALLSGTDILLGYTL